MAVFFAGDSLIATGNLLEVTSLGTRLAQALVPSFEPERPSEIGYSSIGLGYSDITGIPLPYIPQPEPSVDLFLGELLFNLPDDNSDLADPVVDFAISAATTGVFGSTSVSQGGTNLGTQPIGLISQAAYIQQSFADPQFNNAYGFGRSDLFVSAGGSNDVLNFLDKDGNGLPNLNILISLLTPWTRDDDRLIDRITGSIVSNVTYFLDNVISYFDDIAIIGPPKLAETPLLLRVAEGLDTVKWSFGGAGQSLGGKFTTFVSRITDNINNELSDAIETRYGGNVLFVDGEEVFDASIPVSYLDFPSISAYQEAYFQDLVHPNDGTAREAAIYLEAILVDSFGGFG